jgi:hypothetical protein
MPCLSLLALLACDQAPMVMLTLPLSALAEEPVTELRGVAHNGKAGALVVPEGGEPTYVEGLPSWPDGVEGLAVVALGEAVHVRHVPEATVAPDGAISQGVSPGSGLDAVLRGATWHLVGAGQGIEPGPWTVTFDDGSHNVTRVVQAPDATEVTWAYEPVTPAESSSGIYDGGEPASGRLDDGQALALWTRVRALQADGVPHAGARAMGTGLLTVQTATGSQRTRVAQEPAADFAAFVQGWR